MTTARTRVELVCEGGSTYTGFLLRTESQDQLDQDQLDQDALSGEAVVITDMFGYQRAMTDPAHSGKVLVFATPQIGNVGWNGEDNHPDGDGSITPVAVVMRDVSRTVSNFRAAGSLPEALDAQGVTGVTGVDTRGLVRELSRAEGPVRVQVNVDKQQLN